MDWLDIWSERGKPFADIGIHGLRLIMKGRGPCRWWWDGRLQINDRSVCVPKLLQKIVSNKLSLTDLEIFSDYIQGPSLELSPFCYQSETGIMQCCLWFLSAFCSYAATWYIIDQAFFQGLQHLTIHKYTQKNNWRILKFFWLYNIWEYNFQTNYFCHW